MARARNIKPGFFKNEELADCQPLARIMFAGLWTIADREGRLEDRPRRIKAEVLPYDNVEADGLLDELAAHGFIVRYTCDAQAYISIPTFIKNQQCHVNEAASVIPPPEQAEANTVSNKEEYHTSTVQVPVKYGANSPLTESLTESLNHESPLTTAPAVDCAFQDFFDEFKRSYPENADGKKPQMSRARAAALKVPVGDRPLVLLAVKHYAMSSSVQRGIVKYAQGFLNPTFWRDYLEEPTGGKGTNGKNQPRSRFAEAADNVHRELFGTGLDEAYERANGRADADHQTGYIPRLPQPPQGR
jgi:hypothetical protein